MAAAAYTKALEWFLDVLLTNDIRAILVDTADYTYSAAHDFLDDVPSGARVATSGALAGKSVTGGVFDATDVVLSSVTGDSSETVILYYHTGTESTSRLVAYLDGVTVTPNGGQITIQWDNGTNKILKLG